MNLIKQCLTAVCCLFFGNVFSQTFTWVGYPTNSASWNPSANFNITTATAGGGSFDRRASTAGGNSPVSGTTGDAAQNCGTYTGLRLEMSGAGNSAGTGVWNNSITVTINFPNFVCAPVTFNIYDITETFQNFSGDNYVNYQDKVTISALDNASNPVIPGATTSGPIDNTVVGNSRVLVANGTNGQCTNQAISVGTTGQRIRQITIVYSNQDPPTHCPAPVGSPPRYGISQYQYIFISPITGAPLPTAAITSPTLACGVIATVLTATTSASSPTYSWTGPGGSVVTSPTASATAVSGAGVYTVVINPGGCSSTATYNIASGGAQPAVTASASSSLNCTTTTVSATASTTSTPVTYNWSGPGIVSGSTSSVAIVNVGGTYNYTVTNTVTGCSTTGTLGITQNTTVPTATASTTSTITCSSTTAVLTGTSTTAGATYSWNPGGTTPTSHTTSVSGAGNYTLTVTDPANGCRRTAVVNVSSNTTAPSTTASATGSISCLAASASTLTGGAPTAATYTWTGPGAITGVNSPSATATTAGNYTLTVTGTNGCTSTAVAAVGSNTTPPSPTASSGGSVTCTTSTVSLTGGPSSLTYTWTGPGFSGGTNSQNAVATAPGNYTLTVTGTNGCTNTAVTSVGSNTTPPSPTASSTGSVTCTTSTVSLTGGPSALTYTWTGPGFSGGVNGQNAVATSSGNYTLTVRGANGCTASTVTTVGSNTTAPTVTATTSGSITCTTNTASLIGNPSALTYTWTGPGFSGGVNSQNAVATSAGNYTLMVRGTNGCTNTAVTTVTTNTTSPQISIGSDKTIDCITSTVTLNGSSTTPGATYSWTAGGSTPTSSTTVVSAAGNYTLTVTNPANGCTSSLVQSVTSNVVSPNVTTGGSQTITCSNTSVTLTGSSSTSGVTYSWSPGGSTPTNSTTIVSANGTYTLIVTDPSNSCKTTSVVTVTSNTTAPSATATDGTLTCVNTTATLNGGPLAGVTYSWTGTGITGPTNQADASVATAGSYTLTTTAPNGCTNTAVSTVSSDLSTSVADAGMTQTITCSSNSVTLNGSSSPGGTANWLGGVCGSSSSFTTTACAPGTYTLEVTNPSSGCTTTATVAVTSSTDVPQATVDNINTITCTNTLSTLGVTVNNPGDITYTWTGPGITGPTNTATTTANMSGTYTITITNTVTNCQSVYTASVPEDTTPVNAGAAQASSITCAATTATLSATPTGTNYGYTWTGPVVSGGNTANPVVNAGGDYEVTITNTDNGCTGTYTVSVPTDTAIPTMTLNPSSVMTTCAAPNVTLTATSSADPNTTYTWTAPSTGTINDPGSSTPVAGGSGVFTVAVTNTVSGCVSAVETVTVLADANTPTLTAIASNTTICSGAAATLTVSGTDTYTWSPNTSSSNSATISVTPTTTTTYSVEGTNTSSGCLGFTSITINVTPTPTVGLSSDVNAVCEGNSATITLTGATTYTLTDPIQVISTSSTVVTPTAQTTYTVMGETAGCASGTQTISIDVNPLPTLAVSNPTTCAGSPVLISASGADTYTWSTGEQSNTITVSPTGNSTYSVTGTNTLTGCSSTVTTTDIGVTPLPTANASANPNTVCTSGSIVLNASSSAAGSTYTWTAGSGINASNQNQGTVTIPASTLSTGTYTYSLMATSPEGCVSLAATTTVSVIDLPNVNFDLSDLSICQGSNGSLSINNPQTGVTYDWSIGGTAVNNANPANVPTTITNTTGTYTVSVIASIASCTNSAGNTLTVTPLPAVALVNPSATACENASAGLEVANPDGTLNYSWTYQSQSVGSGSSININPLTQGNTGNYTVTATDANGCSNRTVGLIDIKLCEVMIPEIFTPNGDGKNDGFEIRNIENYPNNHLKIFNRWGNLVYQKDGYLNDFVGYANTGDAAGKEKLPSGTYYVILDFGDQKTEVYNGFLLLQY